MNDDMCMNRYKQFIRLACRALHVGQGITAAETLGRARQIQLEAPEGPEKRRMQRIYSLVLDRLRRSTRAYHAALEGQIGSQSEWDGYVKTGKR